MQRQKKFKPEFKIYLRKQKVSANKQYNVDRMRIKER